MVLSEDFKEFIALLNANGVKYYSCGRGWHDAAFFDNKNHNDK